MVGVAGAWHLLTYVSFVFYLLLLLRENLVFFRLGKFIHFCLFYFAIVSLLCDIIPGE